MGLIWIQVFAVTATVCGLVVMTGSLFSRPRGAGKWAMIIGSILATAGLGLSSAVVLNLSMWFGMNIQNICLGSICLGAMIFAMGFLVNQVRYRAAVRYQEQLDLVAPRDDTHAVERPPQHE